jgi:hypothetical protein
MSLFAHEYAKQDGGSMDFWDSLDETRKRRCRELVRDLLVSPDEVPDAE